MKNLEDYTDHELKTRAIELAYGAGDMSDKEREKEVNRLHAERERRYLEEHS